MIMAVSGHWELRLVNNVYQVCCLFYLKVSSIQLTLILFRAKVQRSKDAKEGVYNEVRTIRIWGENDYAKY
jgi:hypothetical protein